MNSPSSFLSHFFWGKLQTEVLFPFPKQSESESYSVASRVREIQKYFAQHSHKKTSHSSLDPDLQDQTIASTLHQLGFLTSSLPLAFQGQNDSASALTRLTEELAFFSPALAFAAATHTRMGCYPIVRYGQFSFQQEVLPQIKNKSAFISFSLTEANSGSDYRTLRLQAKKTEGGYLLNGHKTWITCGDIASHFIVFARTSLSDENAKPQTTAFCVPKSEHVIVRAQRQTTGMKELGFVDIEFKDAYVPSSHMLGELGEGFPLAMATSSEARFSISAICLGMMKRMAKALTVHVEHRRAFGRPLSEFGLTKDKIGTLFSDIYAIESMLYFTSFILDSKKQNEAPLETAACKIYATEALWSAVDLALLLAGGDGFDTAKPFESFLRDSRALFMVCGTNDVLRSYIALSGVEHLNIHSSSKQETITSQAMRSIEDLSSFALHKAKSVFQNKTSLFIPEVLGLEFQLLEEYTLLFGRKARFALDKFGDQINEKQFAQKRLSNMVITLFAYATTLSRTVKAIQTRGTEGALREIHYSKLVAFKSKTILKQNADAFSDNDDELRRNIAGKAYLDGGYPFDIYE